MKGRRLLVSSGGEEWAVLGVKIEVGDDTVALPALHLQGDERGREHGRRGAVYFYVGSEEAPCMVMLFYSASVAALAFHPSVGVRFFYGEARVRVRVRVRRGGEVFYRWRHGRGGEGGGILDRLGSKAGQAHAWHDAGRRPNG
jgi:hypothetical protein